MVGGLRSGKGGAKGLSSRFTAPTTTDAFTPALVCYNHAHEPDIRRS